MITVTTSAGDTAYAEDPESAIVAARTLLADARRADGTLSFNPTATFLDEDGTVIAANIRSQQL